MIGIYLSPTEREILKKRSAKRMEITGGKVTTEVKHPASYQDDRKEYFITLEFDIPGGTACFKLPSSEDKNKAIEAVVTLRGKK